MDTVLPLTKKQKTVPGETRKSWTWHYYLTRELEDGIIEHVEVCKNVYYNTLQVKEKFVRVAVSSTTTGIAKQDQRGKKAPANKTKAGNLQTVHDHLNMFQKVESHYSRKDSKKLYIADTSNFHKLTIMKMCNLYKEKCSDDNIKPVGYDTYRKEFHKMNLAIYKHKKDQCKTCVAFLNKTPNDEQKKEQEKHVKKKTMHTS